MAQRPGVAQPTPGPYILGPLEGFVSPASTPASFNLSTAFFLWQTTHHPIHGIRGGGGLLLTYPLPQYPCTLTPRVGMFPRPGQLAYSIPLASVSWYTTGHLAQVGPGNSGPGILLGLLRKSFSLSIVFAKLVTRGQHEKSSFLRKGNQTEESKAKRWSMTLFLTTSFKYLDPVLFIRYAHWTFLLC